MTAAPIYAVIDKRYDGSERIVLEVVDPQHAAAAAELLRAQGDRDVRVDLLSVRDAEGDE